MFFAENELSLELLGVFRISRKVQTTQKSHKRNYDSLSLRLEGSGKFKTEDKTFKVQKGDVLYLPQNADYTQKTAGEKLIAIHFINYNFNRKAKIEIIKAENTEYVEKIALQMYDIWKEKKQGYRHKCTSLLYELLYLLNCQEHEQIIDSITSDQKIKNAIDYIHTNYRSGSIDISYLAKMCSVSETYFRKLFKMIYGVSPKQYILNLKLEIASQLLQSGFYTISEVSDKSGFNDEKYFSKLFKKRFGITPKEFSKNENIRIKY
ncbi:MAG: helix-turn-helix transcriptional regulator [Ruminococcaceae bacterium]|nr:helix-turn-helix transcriptional regulator [Oscillospiraceae bacterium]